MGYGSTGKILHVDLTNAKFSFEAIGEEVYRLYPAARRSPPTCS